MSKSFLLSASNFTALAFSTANSTIGLFSLEKIEGWLFRTRRHFRAVSWLSKVQNAYPKLKIKFIEKNHNNKFSERESTLIRAENVTF